MIGRLVKSGDTGESKRCAIVFFVKESGIDRTLEQRVHIIKNRKVRVMRADQDKKGTKKITTTNLFVGNLSEATTSDEVSKLFLKYGEIVTISFFRNASTLKDTKNAKITFSDPQSVHKAFNDMNNRDFKGQSLVISPLKVKKGQFDDFTDTGSEMLFQQFASAINYSIGTSHGPAHPPGLLEPIEQPTNQPVEPKRNKLILKKNSPVFHFDPANSKLLPFEDTMLDSDLSLQQHHSDQRRQEQSERGHLPLDNSHEFRHHYELMKAQSHSKAVSMRLIDKPKLEELKKHTGSSKDIPVVTLLDIFSNDSDPLLKAFLGGNEDTDLSNLLNNSE